MHPYHASLLMVLALANSSLAIAASSTSSASGSSSGTSSSSVSSSAGAGHGSFASGGSSHGGRGFGARGAAQVTAAHLRAVSAHTGNMPTHPHYLRFHSAPNQAIREWANFCLDNYYEQEKSVDPFRCGHATKALVDYNTGVPIG